MKRYLGIGLLLTLVMLIMPGLCLSADFNERIRDQQERINQGIRSGELTRAEADVLQDNLDRIKHRYSRMKADGRLTSKEQAKLDQMLDHNSRMIYNKKHNPVTRLEVEREVVADFNERIRDQQKRINQGIRSGELTRAEADILQDNLDRIKARYSRMKADGRLTAAEQDRLDQMLDHNSRMIYNKKHNPVTRLDVERGAIADFHERIRDQQERINQGIRSGELTEEEADILQDNLDRIRERYSRMKADGKLTAAEQDRLDRMLDQNSQMIYNKKHNPVWHIYHGEHESHFSERIRSQQERINQGIRSGELTRSEADILQDNLDRIKARYSRMKADGKLTAEERERMDRMLDRNSRMIRDKKNNPVKRLDWDTILIPLPLLPPPPPPPIPIR